VTPSKLAKEFGLSEDEVIRIIKSAKQKLREYRDKTRIRPDLDDKIIVSWNGLAVAALAKCSTLFGEIDSPMAVKCRAAAIDAVAFIRENLFELSTGQLWRIYRDGSRANTPGFADDYAYLINGLLSLYEATFDDNHLQFALQLQSESLVSSKVNFSPVTISGHLNAHFIALGADLSVSAGYYTTSSTPISGVPGPLLRLKGGTESATPSVNGVIARNLLWLYSLLEDEEYLRLARQTCSAFAVEIIQHPFLFVGLLDAVVGLEIGIRNVTGILCTADTSASNTARAVSKADEGVSSSDLVIRRLRIEAGPGTSTSTTTLSLVDIRPSFSEAGDRNKTAWLRSRNPLFKDLNPGQPPRNFLLICQVGTCCRIDI
jgi:uncharacterized protein YyaL (SSP411 family)